MTYVRERETRASVRRVPLVRYPYVVHYAIIDGEVMILRIIHGARRDRWERPTQH